MNTASSRAPSTDAADGRNSSDSEDHENEQREVVQTVQESDLRREESINNTIVDRPSRPVVATAVKSPPTKCPIPIARATILGPKKD